MGLRAASCTNAFTYTLFTIFPIIMFSTILVLKLRENYLQQIDHLHSSLAKFEMAGNQCRSDLGKKDEQIISLAGYQEKCRDTLSHVSVTLDSLSKAFRFQWEHSNRAEAQLQATLVQFSALENDLLAKDNLTTLLQANNTELAKQVELLSHNLNNVTYDKQTLESQLGQVKQDFDGLKSNTSRLEGEKKGLEQVLKVKTTLDDDRIETANQVIGLATAGKAKKKLNLLESSDEDNEKIEKVVEKSIKKLAAMDQVNKTNNN